MGDLEVLSVIEDLIYQEIKRRLSATNIKFEDLVNAPPEFRAEALEDPIAFKSYQYFTLLKNSYKQPVALLALYIIERKIGVKVKEIYYHDLIAGSPAWMEGYSGRDLDLVIIVNRKPDLEIVKKIERYIDEVVGLAIWLYFKEKGEVEDYKPFNEVIGHNLVELHLITNEEKGKFVLEGGLNGPKVERADINKLRKKLAEIESRAKKQRVPIPIRREKYLIELDL